MQIPSDSLLQHLTVRNALGVQAIFGLVSHAIFKKYEPFSPLPVLILTLVIPGTLSILLLAHLSFLHSLLASFLSYHVTLLTSILVYRLGPFHPLAKYPGPLACKLSVMHMAIVAYQGVRYKYIRKLHEQYGDIVRIGPNEVSIRDVTAIAPLMGPNGLPKGPMWIGRTMGPAVLPLVAQQDAAEHLRRRKPWNRAFNTAALKGYEPVVAERVSQFAHALKNQIGVTDLAQWINYFSFDVMSDMAFGGGSELMRDGDVDKIRWLMDSTMRMSVVLETLPWLRGIVPLIPPLTKDLVRFRSWCFQRATHRIQSRSSTMDLFHYLNNEDGVDKVFPPLAHVVSDAVLAVVAGSDTTSIVLSNTLFAVLRNPDVYSKLKAEVDLYYPPGENACDTQHYAKMVYLDAVINEAMRLYPANPSGSQRASRASGFVGSYFIPEGTAVRVHPFSLVRDPRYFAPLTDTFWPERWLLADSNSSVSASEAEKVLKGASLVHNPSAFIPFSFGPANCVGKNLAMLEMRMFLCCCIQQLEMSLAGDLVDDPGKWERELKDYTILDRGHLPVVVKSRGP